MSLEDKMIQDFIQLVETQWPLFADYQGELEALVKSLPSDKEGMSDAIASWCESHPLASPEPKAMPHRHQTRKFIKKCCKITFVATNHRLKTNHDRRFSAGISGKCQADLICFSAMLRYRVFRKSHTSPQRGTVRSAIPFKSPSIEEPDEVKISRPVLKTSGSRKGNA